MLPRAAAALSRSASPGQGDRPPLSPLGRGLHLPPVNWFHSAPQEAPLSGEVRCARKCRVEAVDRLLPPERVLLRLKRLEVWCMPAPSAHQNPRGMPSACPCCRAAPPPCPAGKGSPRNALARSRNTTPLPPLRPDRVGGGKLLSDVLHRVVVRRRDDDLEAASSWCGHRTMRCCRQVLSSSGCRRTLPAD